MAKNFIDLIKNSKTSSHKARMDKSRSRYTKLKILNHVKVKKLGREKEITLGKVIDDMKKEKIIDYIL